jgi:glycerophosphoryl diester phosphodiesterase
MALDGDFLIIGHRGAAGLEPENTLRSFARAVELGVDAVELDLYHVDGHLIVIHDDSLERTTNGRGAVMQTPFDVLRALDAGSGERIPTLEEVFELIAGRVSINVELKGRGTAKPLAQLLAARGVDDVLVSSFDHRELARFHRAASKIRTAPLFGRATSKMFDIAGDLDAWSINLSTKLASAALTRRIDALGYRCLVYTVNDPVTAQHLKAAGVDGIFTDFPDRMRAVRSAPIVE